MSTSKDFQPMIPYRFASYFEPLELFVLFFVDTEMYQKTNVLCLVIPLLVAYHRALSNFIVCILKIERFLIRFLCKCVDGYNGCIISSSVSVSRAF